MSNNVVYFMAQVHFLLALAKNFPELFHLLKYLSLKTIQMSLRKILILFF